MNLSKDLSHDCSACAGMCCVAHKLEKEEDVFAFDKNEGEVCEHLTVVEDHTHRFQCGVWESLERLNCNGCLNYRCGGAGNFVTQLFVELGLPADYRRAAGTNPDFFKWLDANRHNLFVWSVKILRGLEKQLKDEWISEEGLEMGVKALELSLHEITDNLKHEGSNSVVPQSLLTTTFQYYFQQQTQSDIAAE